jgi:hypothetical protein
MRMAPQLHEILIRAGWREPDNDHYDKGAGQ